MILASIPIRMPVNILVGDECADEMLSDLLEKGCTLLVSKGARWRRVLAERCGPYDWG